MELRRRLSSLIAMFVCVTMMYAQGDDPVLFTVENNPVHVSEFRYIYEKNNGDKADYSTASLEEYLDLYTKFKYKVNRAKEMGLDTVKNLQSELEGYRKQLAESYLTDKEVTSRLIDEVSGRMQTEVKVRHIFMPIDKKTGNITPENKNKLDQVYIQLQQGKDFGELAKQNSQDKASSVNGGLLGYYTAPLPSGFYNFENAMYEAEVGDISKPFSTKMGWHIIKIEDKRPASGEVEIAHILIRKKVKGEEVANASAQADSLYKALQNGSSFADLAANHSQDKNTAKKAGYLGFAKRNQYDKAFEAAAFGLEKDGDISSPVETKFGYHIIQRKSKLEYGDLEKNKKRVKSKLAKDERLTIAKNSMIEKIKKDAGLTENSASLNQFVGLLNEEFYSYKWQIPTMNKTDIASFANGTSYTNMDFANFCKKNTRKRLRFNKEKALKDAVDELYQDYLDEITIKYEEANLEKKYPDFKALMREYEEGILLFEATKLEVWDKATEDSTGLQNYYAQNKNNYKWEERAEVTSYRIQNRDAKTMKKIMKHIKKYDLAKLQAKYNTGDQNLIESSEKTIDKSSEEAKSLVWKVGSLSTPDLSNRSFTTVQKITKIIPSGNKGFDEARGYIIADYQDELEKMWIKGLKEKYSLDVDQKVFDALVK